MLLYQSITSYWIRVPRFVYFLSQGSKRIEELRIEPPIDVRADKTNGERA